jgi:hypothetical protein
MKYLIGIVFLFLSLGLSLVAGMAAYNAVTEQSVIWFLVCLPVTASAVVSWLITSVGLSVPRNY